MSGRNKSVSASLITTGYAIPIALLNPYLAGGIFVDYRVRGRFPRILEHAEVLEPEQLSKLTELAQVSENPARTNVQTGALSAVRITPATSSATTWTESDHQNP
jgi:hypothetical protein